MLSYVDTHCHLDHHDELGVAEQVSRAREASVDVMITIGTDMASSTQAVRTASRHDAVWAVVGIHPNDAMEATDRVLEVISRLAKEPEVVGIGETGMDFYRDYTTPRQQEDSFRAHIDLAREHDKTLVIHCRDAWAECLRILEDQGPPDRVVMHCFSGTLDVVEHCAERGYYLSFAGNVTFKNADDLRTAAARSPRELLLTETDSPFLTPHPHRGSKNQPSMIPLVAATLAEAQGTEAEDLVPQIRENALRAFAIDPATVPATVPAKAS